MLKELFVLTPLKEITVIKAINIIDNKCLGLLAEWGGGQVKLVRECTYQAH
jgi:hypothetical protein